MNGRCKHCGDFEKCHVGVAKGCSGGMGTLFSPVIESVAPIEPPEDPRAVSVIAQLTKERDTLKTRVEELEDLLGESIKALGEQQRVATTKQLHINELVIEKEAFQQRAERAEQLVASYDRQDELIGTEFEGVDEVTEVIRLLKQERDTTTERAERLEDFFLRYARHQANCHKELIKRPEVCAVNPALTNKCSCGLDELRANLSPKK